MSQIAFSALIEKAAVDNGFDLGPFLKAKWHEFRSTNASVRIWLSGTDEHGFRLAVDRVDIANEIGAKDEAVITAFPKEACAARAVPTIPQLHDLVRRVFILARTLPNRLLDDFVALTASFPRATEAERMVVQRVGQDLFRSGLIEYWNGRCAITGLTIVDLLRASHIKPWACCQADTERLDIFNGFLLAPHLDAVFDRGLVTFLDNGCMVLSPLLGDPDIRILCLDRSARISGLASAHRPYLAWHRANVFKGASGGRDIGVSAEKH